MVQVDLQSLHVAGERLGARVLFKWTYERATPMEIHRRGVSKSCWTWKPWVPREPKRGIAPWREPRSQLLYLG